MKNKVIMAVVISVLVMIISGCSAEEKTMSQSKNLYISSATTSVGVDDLNTDTHILSHEFSLQNDTDQKVFINYAEPVFDEEFKKILISKDTKTIVQKELLPKSTITIKGNRINFNAKGLTKEQINKMSPYITDIKINCDQVIGFAKKSE